MFQPGKPACGSTVWNRDQNERPAGTRDLALCFVSILLITKLLGQPQFLLPKCLKLPLRTQSFNICTWWVPAESFSPRKAGQEHWTITVHSKSGLDWGNIQHLDWWTGEGERDYKWYYMIIQWVCPPETIQKKLGLAWVNIICGCWIWPSNEGVIIQKEQDFEDMQSWRSAGTAWNSFPTVGFPVA